MARWSGELEFEFVESEDDSDGGFVATGKVGNFILAHLAKGEIRHAVLLYEQGGPDVADELLAQANVVSQASKKAMADMFLESRDFKNAARLYELAAFIDAASLYEQAQDWPAAARIWEKHGEFRRAGLAYERAGDYERALAHYGTAQASDAMAALLARLGRYSDAAGIFRQVGNLQAEIEMLRLVPIESAERVPAVIRMGELLERYGHLNEAVTVLMDAIRGCVHARMHQPMYMQLARVLDALGRGQQAADVRSRIQNLLSGQTTTAQPASTLPAAQPEVLPVAPQPTAPVAPQPTTTDPFATLQSPFQQGQGPAEASSIDAYTHLKQIPIFAELKLEDMKALYRVCSERVHAPGTVVIEQGVAGNGLVVLTDGILQVAIMTPSGEKILAELSPGEYAGELSLVDDIQTSARVIAKTATRALHIDKAAFQQFLFTHENAALAIYRLFTRTLASRLRDANQKAANP